MVDIYSEQVREVADGVISQPDAYTCQSACVAMALGKRDVYGIRHQLEAMGDPGNPYNMGSILVAALGSRYEFDANVCLSQVRDWLKAGEFLITHGWFTHSGHVICLDGLEVDSKNLSYKLSVKDPWGEFSFSRWSYTGAVDRFDGLYSSYGIYAACVVSQDVYDAAAIYRRGELDSSRKGAWVHRIRPQ